MPAGPYPALAILRGSSRLLVDTSLLPTSPTAEIPILAMPQYTPTAQGAHGLPPSVPSGPVVHAGVRRPRSDTASAMDVPPAQRGPWMFVAEYGCVLHNRGCCRECMAFSAHVSPAMDTYVYLLAREDQADTLTKTARREGYLEGWKHSAQEAVTLDGRLKLAEARIRELEADLRRPSALLTRGIAAGRAGYGRGFRGGGPNRGRGGRPYPHEYDRPHTPTTHTAMHAQTHDGDELDLSDKPTSINEVDRMCTAAATDDPVGAAAVRQARHWVHLANQAARDHSINPTQSYLLTQWRIPHWLREKTAQPSNMHEAPPPNVPQPTLDDPLDLWIAHYDAHGRAPLPIGVHRDLDGKINANLLRGHLLTVTIVGHGPRRNYLRREGQLALACLFVQPQVYPQMLAALKLEPSPELKVTALTAVATDGLEATDHRDRLDFTVQNLATHCAQGGITAGMIPEFLMDWAQSFLEACPAPATEPTAQAAIADDDDDDDADDVPPASAETGTQAVDTEDTVMADPVADDPLPFASGL